MEWLENSSDRIVWGRNGLSYGKIANIVRNGMKNPTFLQIGRGGRKNYCVQSVVATDTNTIIRYWTINGEDFVRVVELLWVHEIDLDGSRKIDKMILT